MNLVFGDDNAEAVIIQMVEIMEMTHNHNHQALLPEFQGLEDSPIDHWLKNNRHYCWTSNEPSTAQWANGSLTMSKRMLFHQRCGAVE